MKEREKRTSKPADDGEWVGLAWRAWCAGERNLTLLGRQFAKKPATVKANLRKYSRARAAEVSDVDPTAEYLDGLQHDLQEALRTYRDADNPNAKVGALKHASAIRKDMAAARGVVTDRRSLAVGQDPGLGPVQVGCTLAVLEDPQACELANALIARLSGGDEQIADETSGPDAATTG